LLWLVLAFVSMFTYTSILFILWYLIRVRPEVRRADADHVQSRAARKSRAWKALTAPSTSPTQAGQQATSVSVGGQKKETCPACGGASNPQCSSCNGSGSSWGSTCQFCGGTGHRTCPRCNGAGYVLV
jgi:hypothetical protein